ncbi:MAG: histidinol dehydrogenase [Byssovorax sp.]
MSLSLPIHLDGTPSFEAVLAELDRRGTNDLEAVAPAVRDIIARVRREGDAGVHACIEAFEKRRAPALLTRDFDGKGALARLDPTVREALEVAAYRIDRYHHRQKVEGFTYEEAGVTLGLQVRPLRRVGVYAPGGKARYPSSVLMTAIPARVAGVKEIVLATPAPNDSLLAAAHLAGVTAILDAGGAHAIAALAYGTESVGRVDKIVGPGNAYVACAKKQVFGEVDIDSIAGPSEILVLADEGANPALVAADLLSQAEHDEAAYCVLVTTSRALAEAVSAAIAAQIETLGRPAIIEASIRRHAAALVVEGRARLIALADRIAAEHVGVHLADADEVAAEISASGATLIGENSPVAVGDYLAGPSHVLPTGGGARFGSPLGVYDFVARTSLIRYSAGALGRQGRLIAALARAEGLDAHARAVELRLENLRPSEAPGVAADER